MWFRKRPKLLVPAFAACLALAALVACHVTGEEQAFMKVKADSSWTSYDQVAVVLADTDGTPRDTLFQGKLTSVSQLDKLPAKGYDGGEVLVILIGSNGGKQAKIETRHYDGRTQTEIGPPVVVIVPVEGDTSKGPVADAGRDTSVQVNTKVHLHGTATDPDGSIAKLEWSIAGGPFSAVAGGDTTFTPSAVGAVRCILRATDNDGKTDLDTVDVTVTKNPPPSITAFTPGDTIVSINDSVAFTVKASGSGPLKSFSWDFNGDGAADENGNLVGATASLKAGKRFADTGTFTVTFKVTDEVGESQTRQVVVTVELDPPSADAGKDTTVEAGTRVNLHGKASDKLGTVVKTEWKIGAAAYVAAVPESGFVAPAVAGTINCILRVTDDDGLRDSDTVVVTVKASVNADLSALTLSTGTLSPAFAAATLVYAASVPETTTAITVTATTASSGSTLTINGVAAVSGKPSASIPLAVGSNAIPVVVTAQDKTTKKTYTLTVTRPTPVPVSWYKFDGNFADSGPNANTGTASGSPVFVADHAGAAGSALSFDGVNDVITTGAAAKTIGNAFTVSFWVKITATTALQYFLNTAGGGIGFATRNGNSVIFAVSIPSTNSASATVTTGTWTHITGTYDGANIRLYANGTLQSTVAWAGTNSGNGNLSNMSIGFFANDYWDGALDDLRFYNRVLNQAEITALANGSL